MLNYSGIRSGDLLSGSYLINKTINFSRFITLDGLDGLSNGVNERICWGCGENQNIYIYI